MTVDLYAAEFIKLSRFAPYMIATEENKAKRFQQGLTLELQERIISFHFKTYEEVLKAAREHEQLSVAAKRTPTGAQKRPFQ
jgi:hypothetical protein